MPQTTPIYRPEPAPNAYAIVDPIANDFYNQVGQSQVTERIHLYLLSLTLGQAIPVLISFEQLAQATRKGIAWVKRILKRSQDLGLFIIEGWTHGARHITITPLLVGRTQKSKDQAENQRHELENLTDRSKSILHKPDETRILPLSLKEEKKKEQTSHASKAEEFVCSNSLEIMKDVAVDSQVAVVEAELLTPKSDESDQALTAVKQAIDCKPSPALQKLVMNTTLEVVMDAIVVLKQQKAKKTVKNPQGFLLVAIRQEWKPKISTQSHPCGEIITADRLPEWCTQLPDPEGQRKLARQGLEVLKLSQLRTKNKSQEALEDELIIPNPGEPPMRRSELSKRIETAIAQSWQSLSGATEANIVYASLLPLPEEM